MEEAGEAGEAGESRALPRERDGGSRLANETARGFGRTSLVLVAIVILVGGTFGYAFREHVSFRREDADPLLWACWLGMLGLSAWRASRRDLPLAFVALVGGALIESWGTRAGLWAYFTGEKPPLFILPAWPMAALATDRVARVLAPHASFASFAIRRWYVAGCIGFALVLLGFAGPGLSHPLTWIALGAVAITMLRGHDRAADVRLFAAGCLVGFPLELWGTTHGCWTYWDGGTPPVASVLSHGFATVAFHRGVHFLHAVASRRDALGLASPSEEISP